MCFAYLGHESCCCSMKEFFWLVFCIPWAQILLLFEALGSVFQGQSWKRFRSDSSGGIDDGFIGKNQICVCIFAQINRYLSKKLESTVRQHCYPRALAHLFGKQERIRSGWGPIHSASLHGAWAKGWIRNSRPSMRDWCAATLKCSIALHV